MAIGLEGKGHHHGVILNAQGQIVAHVWGHVKVTNPDFRFERRPGGGSQALKMSAESPKMSGFEGTEEASLF